MSLPIHLASQDAVSSDGGGPCSPHERHPLHGALGGLGSTRTLLAARNLGLLCDDPSLEEALLAYRAAVDLGGHVALVRPRFDGDQERRAIPETAHMLGRLYDVIACVGLSAEIVEALRAHAGVPVVSDGDIGARAAATPASPIETCDGGRLHQWARALAGCLA